VSSVSGKKGSIFLRFYSVGKKQLTSHNLQKMKLNHRLFLKKAASWEAWVRSFFLNKDIRIYVGVVLPGIQILFINNYTFN